EAAFRLYPQVSKVKEVLFKEAGLGSALMSGSGSAVFGLVDSRKEGLRIAKRVSRFKDWKVFVVKTK
ncbi:MAG TPA: 4-(cytidine 5'-diphospho)-2-C-methyl-D-erythritol kinase, partial [Candidatus Omnitrophota bacterium]|nr:4-(cytidine 5'-diphospho)-2-C-methyl-D-erythritol kinase [Candidatus Omnitrophota bacterium]